MAKRPRYPKTDKNHTIVPEFCESIGGHWRGYPLMPMDTSSLGGNFLDWVLPIGEITIWIEVKTEEMYQGKDHGLTEGEQEFIDNHPDIPVIIAATYQHLADGLEKHA